MYEYTRDVQYYETDKMGVVHHSNYARWMEEARNAYFNEADLAYAVTESYGIMSPVTDMAQTFKNPARFGERFTVRCKMIKYTGVRFRMFYSIVNQEGTLLVEAESGHAFIDSTYKPVPLSKAIPERHRLMQQLLEAEKE